MILPTPARETNRGEIFMKEQDYIYQIPELAALAKDADHVDVKTATGDLTLRQLIAGIVSYQPGWMTFLYRVRGVFLRFLGMKQESAPQAPRMSAENVSMTPGEDVYFFTVRIAEEDRYWVGDEDDTHLYFCFIVAAEPLDDGQRRFHAMTVVRYHNWVGRIYFNVIRPFHHLVVGNAVRSAARGTAR
jgi:hypothetical protein